MCANGSVTDALLANQLASQLHLSSLARDKTPLSPHPIRNNRLPRSPGTPNLAAQAESCPGSQEADSSCEGTTPSTVSPPSDASGLLGEDATKMEEHEHEEGKFFAQPLEVHNGIAVLEESVEMHVPDLVTQV